MCNQLFLSNEKYPMCTWERCETIFSNFSNIEMDYTNIEIDYTNDFAEFDIKIESKRGNRHIKQDAFEETNDFNDNSYIETIIIVNAISICCHITLFSRYARAVLEQNLNIAAIQF